MKNKSMAFILILLLAFTMMPMSVYASPTYDVTITNHVAGNLQTEIDNYMTTNSISNYSDITGLSIESSDSTTGGAVNNKDQAFLYTSNLKGSIETLDLSETSIDFSTTTTGLGVSLQVADAPNKLPQYAYGNWYYLKSIVLPDSVTDIADWAFSRCDALESIYLPDSLNSIGYRVFYWSTKLADVYTDSNTPPASVHPNAFVNTSEGAVNAVVTTLHVPNATAAVAWDAKDGSSNGKLYRLKIENMAPILSIYPLRSSVANAAVSVYSNEAATCSYAAVKAGEAAPTLDPAVGGVAIDADSELNISLSGLENSEYDFYITAVDSLGNQTTTMTAIEQYSDPVDVVIDDHETGELGSEVIDYLDALGITNLYKVKTLKVSGEPMDDEDWSLFTPYDYLTNVTTSINLYGTSADTVPASTFEDYSELTEVSLPAGVDTIEAKAFEGCDKLAEVTIHEATPPTVSATNAFSGVATDAIVYVPQGSAVAYQAVDDGDTTDNLWYGLVIHEISSSDPVIDSVTPSGSGVAVQGNIVITFGQSMNTAAAGTVSLDGGTTFLSGGSWSGSTVYTIPYSGLSKNKTYTIRIAGFSDVDGNSVDENSSYTFTTIKGSTGGGSGGHKDSSNSGNDSTEDTPATPASPTDTASGSGQTFTDVNQNNWFYNHVKFIQEKGLMNGMGNGSFNPSGTMTRGMIVTVLQRLSGETGSFTNTFSDVPAGSWYGNAASWAAANGIAGGTGNDSFAPNNTLTREQLAVMLYNYAKYKGLNTATAAGGTLSQYSDAGSISTWANDAVNWAVGAGILTGDGTNLAPKASATRAEVAAMLQRFIENVIKE